MELEFHAYGHEIHVTDVVGRHIPAEHSKGLVFVVDRPAPQGEVYDSGAGRVEAKRDGKLLGVYDTAENAARAVARAALGIPGEDEGRLVAAEEAARWLDQRGSKRLVTSYEPERIADRIRQYVEEIRTDTGGELIIKTGRPAPLAPMGETDDDLTVSDVDLTPEETRALLDAAMERLRHQPVAHVRPVRTSSRIEGLPDAPRGSDLERREQELYRLAQDGFRVEDVPDDGRRHPFGQRCPVCSPDTEGTQ